MAIALRGTPTTNSATNGGNITLNMPAGVAQNDVVIVGYAMNAAGTGGTSSGGWTQIGANVTNTVRIQIFRKVMGAVPDTSIVLTGSTLAADSSSAIAIAFSGVNTGAPENGVTLTSATGTSTNPDCPSITPTITGSVVVAYAAGAAIDTTGTGGPGGYSNFTQVSSNDNNDTTSYLAWKGSLTAGTAEDPSAFTGVSSVAWAAYTICLAPPGTIDATAAGSYALTGTAATPKHAWRPVADVGSYALTGTAATLRRNLPIVAGAGSYALTGTAATPKHAWIEAAGAGSYSLSGATAGVLHQWKVAAGVGSYVLTGTDATLTKTTAGSTYTISAGAGSYLITSTCTPLVYGSGGRLYVDLKRDFCAVGDGVADDSQPLINFGAWARAQSLPITLNIPAGTYEFTSLSFPNQWPFRGIADLVVECNGATVNAEINFGAVQGNFDDNVHSARIQTVAAGSNYVTLLNSSDLSIFTAGDWVFVSALDLQGFGSPPNPYFFEYQEIASIDSGNSRLYFTDTLAYTYKSTYPLHWGGDGFHPDQGGPATVYRLAANWDCVNTVRDLTIEGVGGQIYFKGREVTFENCNFNNVSTAPTACISYTATNCTYTDEVEIDKITNAVIYDTCTFNDNVRVQSGSVNSLIATDCDFQASLFGTPKTATLTRCTIGTEIRPYAYAYGTIGDSLDLVDCDIPSIVYYGTQGTFTDFTYSSGTLTRASTPLEWAVPGHYAIFGDNSGAVFRIDDIRASGADTVIDTNYVAANDPPPSQYGAGGVGTANNAMQSYKYAGITASGCTGSLAVRDLNEKGTRKALEYTRRTSDDDTSGGYSVSPEIFGWLDQLRINVTRAYTGVQGTLKLQIHTLGVYDASRTWLNAFPAAEFHYSVFVNLKTVGDRIIAEAGNSGTQTGDDLPTIPAGSIWYSSGGGVTLSYNADISAEDPSLWPIWELTFTTDHDLPSASVIAEAGSYALTGTAATLTYTPAVPTTRGELPIETKEHRRKREKAWRDARKARDKLRDMLTASYEGREYIDPDEVAAVETDALAAFNALQGQPNVSAAQLREMDQLIRHLQDMQTADLIVREHLLTAVDLSHQILRKKDEEDAVIALLTMG